MSMLHVSNQRVDDSRVHLEGERRTIVSVLTEALGIRYLRIFVVEVSENIQIRIAWIVVCIRLEDSCDERGIWILDLFFGRNSLDELVQLIKLRGKRRSGVRARLLLLL